MAGRQIRARCLARLGGLLLCAAAATAHAQMLQSAPLPPSLSPRFASRPAPAAQPESGGPPRVAVLVVGLDSTAQDESVRLETLTYDVLSRFPGFELVRMVDAIDPASARERVEQELGASQAMKDGLKAYNDLDTQKAQQLFEQAMQGYGRSNLSAHFKDYIQAWVMKVASRVANGESRAAQRELERLLALDPRAELSNNYFPPDMIAYGEKVRRSPAGGRTSNLEIRTAPVAAEITVDGVPRGRAPISLTELPATEHFITAMAPGYSLLQVKASDGVVALTLRPAELQSSYTAALRGVLGNPKGKERDLAAAALGRAVGVSQVVLVIAGKSIAGQKLDVKVIRVASSDAHNLGYTTSTLVLDDTVPAQWSALIEPVLATEAPRVNGKPVNHYEAAPGWSSRSTGWVLLGAGAAMVGGGLFFGYQASGLNQRFRTTAQTEGSAEQLRSTGQSYALLADVFALAGLAAALPGGYLAFLAPDPGAKEKALPARRAGSAAELPPGPIRRTPRTDEKKTQEKKLEIEDDLRNY